jgi:hypothetical protein
MINRLGPIRTLPALLGLCLAAPAAGAWNLDCRYSADLSASVDTTSVRRVEIAARAGDLAVHAGPGNTVIASGRACASSQAYLQQTRLHARRQGDTVLVVVEVPEEMKGIGLLYATLDLTVTVPAGLEVDVSDSSGDVTVKGVHLARITDSSGDIVASDLTGDVEIRDSSGDVSVFNASGAVRINDSSGDILIRGARDVVVRNDSSGDMTIEHVTGDVRIQNDSSGDIGIADVGRNVEVMADTTGELRVSGVKGTVKLPE